MAGDGSLDPARVNPVSDFRPTPVLRVACAEGGVRLKSDTGMALRGRCQRSSAARRSASRASIPVRARSPSAPSGTCSAGVPMHWMAKWPGGFPLFVAEARGSRFTDVDGHEYVDFCLGDTGAMSGHAPEATLRAVAEQAARGITTMLPTEDALGVAEELTRRFGVTRWQFALTATDANRFSIRLARHITGRPKVLVFNWCYHGTVDETFATLEAGGSWRGEGNLGPPVPPRETTKVVEWNDLEGLEAALAPRRRRAASSPSRRSRTSASSIPSPGSTTRSAR